MNEEQGMQIVFGLDGDPTVPLVAVTTPQADVPQAIIPLVGVGNPYYAFTSLSYNGLNGIEADFTGAPLCSDDVAVNRTNINTMLASPPYSKITAL
jgi:hypothetical protein